MGETFKKRDQQNPLQLICLFRITNRFTLNAGLYGIPFTLAPKVTSVTLDSKINCTNLPNPTSGCLYENPGNGNPGTRTGLRIFPDKAQPTELIDRRTVQVKATVGAPNIWVHFRNFDVDDPSYSSAPVDDDSGVKINEQDNRPVGEPKAGLLGCPSGSIGICESESNGVKAKTDASGIATAEFRVTMQPGDNFVVAASTDKTYADGIKVAATDLQDNTGQFIPIAENVSSNAKRSQMLTIWRFVHLEIDSMGKVENNNLTVPIGADVTVGSSPVIVPILGFPRRPLEYARFESGKLVSGSSILEVDFNEDYDLHIHSAGNPVDIGYGQIFDLFDDDDYNRMLLPGTFGDNGEEIEERPETFSRMREFDSEVGNSFAKAYIRPEYTWAINKGYNQGNLPFKSNVAFNILEDQIEPYRDSKNDENDGFWVAYLQLAYQGGVREDNDPRYEEATGGVMPDADTDDDPPPPPPPGLPPLFPSGGHGAIIYMETCRDVDRDFDGGPNPFPTIWCVEAPVHELGHQFGLKGDTTDYSGQNYFGVMGYSRQTYSFVERHINLMRSRVKSPGELGY